MNCIRCKTINIVTGIRLSIGAGFICNPCRELAFSAFDRSEFFNMNENFGTADLMDGKLIFRLDFMREVIGKPFIIHAGYGVKGHKPAGYHPLGQAVDFHVHNGFLDADYQHIKAIWPGGVGFYPHWKKPGFHLDLGPKRAWFRNKKGEYK